MAGRIIHIHDVAACVDRSSIGPPSEEDLAACAGSDAVFFGAVGDPKYDDPKAGVRPEQALLALRKVLGLYANLRPVKVQPESTAVIVQTPPGAPLMIHVPSAPVSAHNVTAPCV